MDSSELRATCLWGIAWWGGGSGDGEKSKAAWCIYFELGDSLV